VLTARRRREPADRLVAAGVLVMSAGDMLDMWRLLEGLEAMPAKLAGACWLAGYSLIVAAALHPSASTPHLSVAMPRGQLSGRRLIAFGIAGCLTPASLLIEGVRDVPLNPILIGGVSMLIFLLVLARCAGLAEDLRVQAAELDRMAHTDPLTHTLNRRGWQAQLEAELARTERSGQPMCVAMLDLDHFKRYNDLHGHLAGDELLARCAAAWRAALRPHDVLARYGGEEFVVLLPGCTPSEAFVVLARLHEHTPEQQAFSAGIAVRRAADRAEDLISRADRALYAAKANGRDRTELEPVHQLDPLTRT
jgi:diguanylate cyclase (GGDEF)-like protein